MNLFGRQDRRATDIVPLLAGAADEWVWPYWLERQRDPASPAAVAGEAGFRANVHARSWTVLGNLDSPLEATVDPRGLVTTSSAGWSIDWWVGADDRWHLPSKEVAVRQHLVGGAPVVESAMRVPSGDIVHRAFAVRDGADEVVVIEIENRSPIPVALALAVRPYGPDRLASVGRISVDGLVVHVDGVPAVVLPKLPSRMAGSTFGDGDVAGTVTAGDAGTERVDVRDLDGMATAAFIWPLPHRTTLRFSAPLSPGATVGPDRLPAAEQVVSGWKRHGERGIRLVLPDERLEAAVEANRRFALLLHDGPAVTDGPIADAVAMVRALGRFGLGGEAAELLVGLVDRQAESGAAGDDTDLLPGLADHLRLHPDPPLVDAVAVTVAELAEELARRARRGIAGAGTQAALEAAAEILRLAGADDAAQVADRAAAEAPEIEAASPTGLCAAAAELATGERRALDVLRAVLDVATPTWTWPPTGVTGEGHDRRAVADLLCFVRDLLVREVDDGLALLSLVPDAWLGRGVELHGAPTAYGALSFAVRWHGDRPALLWELAPHPGIGPVRLTVPGLDPTWSSDERRGDALLAPVLPPGTPVTLKGR